MVTLQFNSTKESKCESKMFVHANASNELYICIEFDDQMFGAICLDKQTAIKFAKEVRKQISYLEDK